MAGFTNKKKGAKNPTNNFDFMERKQVSILCFEFQWCGEHFANTRSQIRTLNHIAFSYKPIPCEGEFK